MVDDDSAASSEVVLRYDWTISDAAQQVQDSFSSAAQQVQERTPLRIRRITSTFLLGEDSADEESDNDSSLRDGGGAAERERQMQYLQKPLLKT